MRMLNISRMKKGAALVEYGILLGLIAVISISAVLGLGSRVKDTFSGITAVLASADLASISPAAPVHPTLVGVGPETNVRFDAVVNTGTLVSGGCSGGRSSCHAGSL